MAENTVDTFYGGSVSLREVLFVLTVAFSSVQDGLAAGWGTVLPKLQQDTGNYTLTEDDVSWLVSLLPLTGMVVNVVSGPLVEWTGPRRLMLLTLLPAVGCWLLMAFTPYLSLLYLGRAGTATSAMFMSVIVQPLVAELSSPRIRGFFLAAPEIATSTGALLSYVLAYVTTWDMATAICAAPLVPILLLIVFVPESPYWLVRRGRVDDAREALRRLRGPTADVAGELSAIMSTPTCRQASVRDQFVELRKSQNLRPVVLLLILFALRELGGRNAIFQYAVYIFHKADVELNAFTCTILVGVTRLLCTCVSASASDRAGRRPLLLATAIVCSLTEGVAGVFLHLKLAGSSWVPLAAVLVFVTSYGLGLGPVPWMYLGELVPTPVRSLGASIVSFFYIISLFGVNYTFLKSISHLGLGVTMMIFAGCNLLLAAIVWQWIPESRGASLQELEQAFFQEATSQRNQNTSVATAENHSSRHPSHEKESIEGSTLNNYLELASRPTVRSQLRGKSVDYSNSDPEAVHVNTTLITD